jgi:hypothetical protein
MMARVLEQAMRLWDTGQDAQLVELAESCWPTSPDAELTPEIAEVCRYARNAARRQLTGSDDLLHFVQFQVWGARAMVAAVLTGARDTAAGLLLGPFFALTAEHQHSAARAVWAEVVRLVPLDHPRSGLFRRLYYEKLAFSFVSEGLFDDARANYMRALDHCADDPRGALKVRGGAAITGYLALKGRPAEEITNLTSPLLEEMRQVHAEAGVAGFRDVVTAAAGNIGLMGSGKFEPWHPFETT